MIPKIIVTGTGRCGTLYMARFLTSIGMPCGHESMFYVTKENPLNVWDRFQNNKRMLSFVSNYDILQSKKIEHWVDINHIVADSSYIAAPFLNREELQDTQVIHLIRNPMDVINSYILDAKYFEQQYPQNEWESFIYHTLPRMYDLETPLERTSYFYVVWSQIIEEIPHRHIHRIESGINHELFDFLGVPPTTEYYNNIKTNSWKKRTTNYTIEDIPEEFRGYIEDVHHQYDYKLNHFSHKIKLL